MTNEPIRTVAREFFMEQERRRGALSPTLCAGDYTTPISRPVLSWTRRVSLLCLLALALVLLTPLTALAHPLGNFTVNRYSRLTVSGDAIYLIHIVDMAEIPAHQERSRMDQNHDGTVDQAEQDAFVSHLLDTLSTQLVLRLNGRPHTWRLAEADLSFPTGQAGLPTLRLVTQWTTNLAGQPAQWQADYQDTSYAERLGWQEIVVQAGANAALEAASVPAVDVSHELRAYPDNLLQSPLAVNQATFRFRLLAGNHQESVQPSRNEEPAPEQAGRRTDPFSELINLQTLTPFTILLALLAAFGWGAAHALSPGHGKTLVAAYLIGSRGTVGHALLLGLTTTTTHTAGVLALGGVTLFATRYIAAETLYPWLSTLSGLLVIAIGVVMIRNRSHALLNGPHDHHSHERHPHDHSHGAPGRPDHDHPHSHDHSHDHAHGHSPHHHALPGADGSPVTWRSLLALGISGGLLPCPSALVLMLAAISLQRVAFGLALIVMFSLGLACVLTTIGVALVYAGKFFQRIPESGPLFRFVPVASALFITLAGIGITVQALMNIGILTLS